MGCLLHQQSIMEVSFDQDFSNVNLHDQGYRNVKHNLQSLVNKIPADFCKGILYIHKFFSKNSDD